MFLPPSPPMVHGPQLDLFRSPWVRDLSSTSNLLAVYTYTHTICAVTCEKYEHGRVYFYQLQIRSTSEPTTSCKPYHFLPSPLDLVTVTISPFWPCFWPSTFSFSHQVHALLKSLCKKTTKISNNIRYPLGTNILRRWGYLQNYLAGVSLRLTPRFAHISSSDPSTAKSSLEGPASGSSRRSSTYSGTGSMGAVVNSLRG
jgi:hypothetical protein